MLTLRPASLWQPESINYLCGHFPWSIAGILSIELPGERVSDQPFSPPPHPLPSRTPFTPIPVHVETLEELPRPSMREPP